MQGHQRRRVLIAPEDLAGSGAGKKAEREEWAIDRHLPWLEFREETEHGNYPRGGHLAFNHYAPDFLYRYVKVPGIGVTDVLTMGVSVLRAANEHAKGCVIDVIPPLSA